MISKEFFHQMKSQGGLVTFRQEALLICIASEMKTRNGEFLEHLKLQVINKYMNRGNKHSPIMKPKIFDEDQIDPFLGMPKPSNRKQSPKDTKKFDTRKISQDQYQKKKAKYNPGSVFHQANKFNPYLSSSTNISSSISESVEIIVSELDCPSDEEFKPNYKGDLSPLGELSENNSEEISDTDAIKTILKKKQNLNTSVVSIKEEDDKVSELLMESMNTILTLQQENEKNLQSERKNMRLQLLELVGNRGTKCFR